MNLIETVSSLLCVYSIPKHPNKGRYLHIWRHQRLIDFVTFELNVWDVADNSTLRAVHSIQEKETLFIQ